MFEKILDAITLVKNKLHYSGHQFLTLIIKGNFDINKNFNHIIIKLSELQLRKTCYNFLQ